MDAGGSKEAKAVIDEAFRQCAMYEGMLSRTREGSDIYNINHADGKPVACDPVTVDLLQKGMEYSALSGGAFDITVGGLAELWDFKSDDPSVPPEKVLKEAAAHTGSEHVEISKNSVRIREPGCRIDLGAIAKGYIADRLTELFEDRGVSSAVIDLGGNIVCVGKKKEGFFEKKFRIGIETPYSDRTDITGVAELSDETAVTSGVYERYFEAGGRKYHHILDPKTGYPAETDLLSVTVVAGTGKSCDCDALATICILKGLDEGKKLIEGMQGYEGLFLDREGKHHTTAGFDYEKIM